MSGRRLFFFLSCHRTCIYLYTYIYTRIRIVHVSVFLRFISCNAPAGLVTCQSVLGCVKVFFLPSLYIQRRIVQMNFYVYFNWFGKPQLALYIGCEQGCVNIVHVQMSFFFFFFTFLLNMKIFFVLFCFSHSIGHFRFFSLRVTILLSNTRCYLSCILFLQAVSCSSRGSKV